MNAQVNLQSGSAAAIISGDESDGTPTYVAYCRQPLICARNFGCQIDAYDVETRQAFTYVFVDGRGALSPAVI